MDSDDLDDIDKKAKVCGAFNETEYQEIHEMIKHWRATRAYSGDIDNMVRFWRAMQVLGYVGKVLVWVVTGSAAIITGFASAANYFHWGGR